MNNSKGPPSSSSLRDININPTASSQDSQFFEQKLRQTQLVDKKASLEQGYNNNTQSGAVDII
jgi:hypothetical protein